METTELLHLWKSYHATLEQNLQLNRKNAEDITKIKVESFLASMRPIKIFAVVVGVLWVLLVDSLIINLFQVASPFFLVSAGIQVLLTKLAIGLYLYQLALLYRVDVSEPILATQQRLANLRGSTLWITRILFLQLPVWTTFYCTTSMFVQAPLGLLILQIAITAAFAGVAGWLFFNIKLENKDQKWFKILFAGREWTPLMRSEELLNQIEEYQRA